MGRATPANLDMLGPSMESIVQPAILEGNASDISEEPIIGSVDSDAEDPPKRPKSVASSAEEKVELSRYNSNLVFKPGETVVSDNLLERR